jgi:hypothetical protein
MYLFETGFRYLPADYPIHVILKPSRSRFRTTLWLTWL